MTIKVKVQLHKSSCSMGYDALNAYVKGEMYCVLFQTNGKRVVHKYPLCSIFRVVEECEDSESGVTKVTSDDGVSGGEYDLTLDLVGESCNGR